MQSRYFPDTVTLWLHVYCFTWGECLLPIRIWHGCALCWLKAALLCTMSHCFHAALHSVLLPSYCFFTVVLFCYHHNALPVSRCFACVILHIVCHCRVALFLSCCFAFVMQFCLCHVVLLLSCCFAFVLLFCLQHVALPLSCCFSFFMLLCLRTLPLSFCFASRCHASLPVSYCFAPVILLQQHLCVSLFWLAWLNPASLPCHCMSQLSFCPAIMMQPYPYHGLGTNSCPLPCNWGVSYACCC